MATAVGYDREKEVKEFDDSKIGVKGLVDSGLTAIPQFFRHHPPPNLSSTSSLSIPTVDLSLPHPTAVDLVRSAARRWGFFHVTNHGIPISSISAALAAFRSFNELPAETKAEHYTRDGSTGVDFSTNFDLYLSDAATWRDTLQIRMGSVPPVFARIPEICREALVAWDEHVNGLGKRLMALLCEGLGVAPGRLEEISCLEHRQMACHYYPYCPQPDLTMGTKSHTDPGVLTVLVQDQIGELQVKWDGEGATTWVDVTPFPGAIVVNVGDLLQIISNDEYKSIEHRVVANSHQEARISIAIFFLPSKKEEIDIYGPLAELLSLEKPVHYRNFTMSEYLRSFFDNQLSSRFLVDHFKLTGAVE